MISTDDQHTLTIMHLLLENLLYACMVTGDSCHTINILSMLFSIVRLYEGVTESFTQLIYLIYMVQQHKKQTKKELCPLNQNSYIRYSDS